MRSFIAILALVAVAAAADLTVAPVLRGVRSNEADAVITKQDADVYPDQYQYSYETSNGISAQESGVLKNVGTDNEGISVEGANSYPGDDGVVYSITYTADENGYQPQGAHLPVPPPIPEYILRAIAYNAANAKPEGIQRP